MLIATVGKRALFFLYVGKDDRFHANKPHGKYQMLHGKYGKWVIEDDRVRFLHMPSDKDNLRQINRQIKVVEYPLDLAAGLAEAFAATKCRRQFG